MMNTSKYQILSSDKLRFYLFNLELTNTIISFLMIWVMAYIHEKEAVVIYVMVFIENFMSLLFLDSGIDNLVLSSFFVTLVITISLLVLAFGATVENNHIFMVSYFSFLVYYFLRFFRMPELN